MSAATPGLPALPPKWSGRFHQRAAVVEAVQLIDNLRNHTEVAAWIEVNGGHAEIPFAEPCLFVETPDRQAAMRADLGDWIVRDTSGEFRVLNPDAFEATYEPAAAVTAQAPGRADEGAFWAWMDAYVDEPHNASYEVPDMQRAYEAGRAAPAHVANPTAEDYDRAADEIARRGEPRSEWAVFWGGEHPGDCAGSDVYGDKSDADENRQWVIGAGMAKRDVWYGPWAVVKPSAAGRAPGEDPDDNLTEVEREEYRQWRAAKGLRP